MAEVLSFEVSAATSASCETIWELVAVATTWPTWTPVRRVGRTGLAPDNSEQVGTLRTFQIGVGRSVEEVTGVFANRRFAYELRQGMPIINHRAAVVLAPTDKGCIVTWSEEFEPKYRGTGTVLRWFLHTFIKRCLRGLVQAAER